MDLKEEITISIFFALPILWVIIIFCVAFIRISNEQEKARQYYKKRGL